MTKLVVQRYVRRPFLLDGPRGRERGAAREVDGNEVDGNEVDGNGVDGNEDDGNGVPPPCVAHPLRRCPRRHIALPCGQA